MDRTLAKAMKEEQKSDVRHLLFEEKHEEKKKTEQKPEIKRAHEKERTRTRMLSPEEQKREERRMRMMSKFQYYLSEYAPYLLLLIIVLAIFIGALYLAGTKLA